jgi:hypothetical protein
MAKPVDGEVLGPPHKYDNPELSPREFLIAVMHDERLPISVRLDAAAKVAVYEHPRLAQVTQDITAGMTIRIEGGLPVLPGTNIIMPETEKVSRKTNGSGSDDQP